MRDGAEGIKALRDGAEGIKALRDGAEGIEALREDSRCPQGSSSVRVGTRLPILGENDEGSELCGKAMKQ